MTTFENPYQEDFDTIEQKGGYYITDTELPDRGRWGEPIAQILETEGLFRNELDAQIRCDELAYERREQRCAR